MPVVPSLNKRLLELTALDMKQIAVVMEMQNVLVKIEIDIGATR